MGSWSAMEIAPDSDWILPVPVSATIPLELVVKAEPIPVSVMEPEPLSMMVVPRILMPQPVLVAPTALPSMTIVPVPDVLIVLFSSRWARLEVFTEVFDRMMMLPPAALRVAAFKPRPLAGTPAA